VTALEDAARMGARAGAAFRTTGTPTPNPFAGRDELAAAWRRAYFAAIRARGRG
jgi:hypothetical protein